MTSLRHSVLKFGCFDLQVAKNMVDMDWVCHMQVAHCSDNENASCQFEVVRRPPDYTYKPNHVRVPRLGLGFLANPDHFIVELVRRGGSKSAHLNLSTKQIRSYSCK